MSMRAVVPALAGLAAAALLAAVPVVGQPAGRYEVWTIDQADGARGGARLYIYDGPRLASGQAVTPEVVNLDTAAAGVGDGLGVRPHMVIFTRTYSHAVIANVASGHVYAMRAADRKIVASIDVGEQAHAAYPSPDDRLILVANQNGKRLARIVADFAGERFVYSRADDLDLGALQDAGHPDNAPVCPILFVGPRAYVTVRGGGVYIVDYAGTPMRVTQSYTKDEIAPAGCGGLRVGGKVYVNSGTAASSDLYVFDAATGTVLKSLHLSWTGTDGHGMVATGGGRYVWMGNRADANIVVISTVSDSLAGLITGIGAAPDIMDLAPDGTYAFAALRGPNNLTGGPSAKGQTPGVAILEVLDGGRNGRRVAFAPIGDQSPASPNDPHALAVRVVR